jgi:hypothetical protein
MPKKTEEVTVPMSKELEDVIVEPLEFGDAKSKRIRELIRQGLVAEGVDPSRIPGEEDQRMSNEADAETDGGQTQLAD